MKDVREGENYGPVSNRWRSTGFLCFRCGWPELTACWLDDDPAGGGGCIGEHRACGNPDCNYWEDV